MRHTRLSLFCLAIACATSSSREAETTALPAADELFVGQPAAPPALVPLPTVRTDAPMAPVLAVLGDELDRAWTALRGKEEKPHFFSHTVYDRNAIRMMARNGALVVKTADRDRRLLTDVRVGTPVFDSSHAGKPLRYGLGTTTLPMDDEAAAATRLLIWQHTTTSYKAAVERFGAQEELRRAATAGAPDWLPAPPVRHLEPPVSMELQVSDWEARLRRLSGRLHAAGIDGGYVSFAALAANRFMATSEGTRVQTGRRSFRVLISTGWLVQPFEADTPAALPAEAELASAIDRLIADVNEFAQAPREDSFRGPAIVAGPAAGVLVHELFAHRLEAANLGEDDRARALAERQGQRVLAPFLSVFDDPTVARFGAHSLPGAYRVDEEGVPAQTTPLVERGLLRGFLLSRKPPRMNGAPLSSNGHARRDEAGDRPTTARQSNLIVTASHTVSEADLRERLRAEARKQGTAYGLLIRELHGRFRPRGDYSPGGPARFGVQPIRAYRVFADGRPDQPVNASELKTVDLARALAASEPYGALAFDCNGESGVVPAAVVSPSLLLESIEIAPRGKGD